MSAKSVYTSTLLIVLAAIAFGVAVGTEYWATYKSTFGALEVDTHGGLWQVCAHNNVMSTTTCSTICDGSDDDSGGSSDSDTLSCKDVKAMRAFGVLAVLMAVPAFALQLLIAADKWPRAYLPGLVLTFAASFCGMVAFAIYADKPPHDPVTFGYSFALEVTGSVVAFVSGLLFWFGARGTGSGYSIF